MNWALPILLTIGTFIGVYLVKQSPLFPAIISALAAFTIGTIISHLKQNSQYLKNNNL